MNKTLLILLIAGMLLVLSPAGVSAAIDLSSGYWETTYDCPEWTTSQGNPSCDGISKNGDWTCNGIEEQITTAANMAAGDGGRGQRHWLGDGKNVVSGGTEIRFNTPQPELWIRWYMRYQSGFAWSYLQEHKLFYFDMGKSAEMNLCLKGIDGLRFRSYRGELYDPSGFGWQSIMGGSTSDGQWHLYEVHIKMDTNGRNGIAQWWIDENLIIDRSDFDFGTAGAWSNFQVPSNADAPANGGCEFNDIDDIAISTIGYIGPVSSGPDTTPPTRSSGLPTGALSSGTTQTSISLNTNEAATCRYSTASGVSYPSMTSTFSTTGGTSHSTTVSGLSDGNTYNYYVRCQDTLGNANTNDYTITFSVAAGGDTTTLFQESFEDTSFGSRGWYDNTGLTLSSVEYMEGSASAEFHFLRGGTTPTSGPAIRHKFTDTDEVYVSYWVKYSSNWDGSNRAYHPHEFLIMTNENSDYSGLAFTYLTAYIEQNEGEPLLSIQDGQNIDLSQIGVNLVGVTESRSVAGCNGDSDGYGTGQGPYNDGECYNAGGGTYWNGKSWKAGSIYFQDNPGQYYKNDWHHIEAYFKLNSISGGIGIADGIVRYWYDGQPLIDHSDVVLRTGQHPSMRFNQFIIAPWIGDGSPVDQTMWVDDLTVATSRAGGSGSICTDGQTRSCSTGLQGVCSAGTETCSSGVWGSCVQTTSSSPESCAGGLDEDCDGLTNCADPDCSTDLSCSVQTCQNQGHSCCNACQTGTFQSQYDSDCSPRVCCGACQTQSQGEVFIFQDSLPAGASIESGDPMAVSTGNPYQGTSNLEITGQGSWSNCRIVNLNIDVTSMDWQNSYLEVMVSSPVNLVYVAVNLWGDGVKAPEQSFSLSGSGSYEVVQIPLSGFSPTQAGFGNALTMFMIGSDWGSSTIHLDEVRVVSPGQGYHRADADKSCTIEQEELLAWIDNWYADSTAYPMWEMMEAVGFYYSGNAC